MTMVGKATRIGQAIQWVLAAAMVGSPMAGAQQVAVSVIPPVPGADMQAGVTMNVGYQVKDDLFGDTGKFANGASEVTEINLDPNTMGMVGRMKGDTAQKMKKMVVHSYKYDKPGMYRMEDLEAYRKKLEDGSWSCSIHVRSKNESTDICSRKASDHETNEMVIMTAAPQELTFIHMSGNLSLDELNDMSSAANGLNRRVTPGQPRVRSIPEIVAPNNGGVLKAPTPPASPAPPPS